MRKRKEQAETRTIYEVVKLNAFVPDPLTELGGVVVLAPTTEGMKLHLIVPIVDQDTVFDR